MSRHWDYAKLMLQIAFIFKCTADVIFLDDFKSVLDRISVRESMSPGSESHEVKEDRDHAQHIEAIDARDTASPGRGTTSTDWFDNVYTS